MEDEVEILTGDGVIYLCSLNRVECIYYYQAQWSHLDSVVTHTQVENSKRFR